MKQDYTDPEFVKQVESWGAVYWHRYAGRLWDKLVESQRANKALREALDDER